MPAYHSKFNDAKLKLANMALLPIRTAIKGPAPKESKYSSFILQIWFHFIIFVT